MRKRVSDYAAAFRPRAALPAGLPRDGRGSVLVNRFTENGSLAGNVSSNASSSLASKARLSLSELVSA